MHHVPGEHLARAREVGGEVEPDPEMVLERDHGHPIVRSDPGQQAVAVLEQPQQTQGPVRLEALLHEEHDELPAVARREDGGEVCRRQGRPTGPVGAIGLVGAEPQGRLDVDPLAAYADLEIVRAEPRHRLALVADDPHVDHDARDVDPLDQRRLLLRREPGRGRQRQRRRHPAAPSGHSVSHARNHHARVAAARRGPRLTRPARRPSGPRGTRRRRTPGSSGPRGAPRARGGCRPTPVRRRRWRAWAGRQT